VPDIITDDLAHRTLTSNALLAIPLSSTVAVDYPNGAIAGITLLTVC
jgi:hypothetical protein